MNTTSATAKSEPYLQARGISRRYGNVVALQGADFEVRLGEVMALLGENGAGKTTLVKVLAGLVTPDDGVISIGGKEVSISSPARSREAGIAVVQQELSLVPSMSVAENLFLGGGPFRGSWSERRLVRAAAPFLKLVGLERIDPATLVESLPVAERQLTEIARLLAREARVLILDEPTAALSDVEIERIKRVVRSLADEGRAIVYVTHRLGEVFEIANRVTVFRNGASALPIEVEGLTIESLVEQMLGRRLEQMFPPHGDTTGEVLLKLDDFETEGLREPISLTLRSGEMLGLAGQLGSGAEFLLRALAGRQPVTSGSLELAGQPLRIHSVRQAIAAGIAYCSGDRKRDGLFAIRSVSENLSAPALDRITRGDWISRRDESALVRSLAGFFQVDPARLPHPARTLSGGNQQKVALGKWLSIEPRILLVEEPTMGVDVGARAEIYAHLRRLADRGLGVVFTSSDLPEVIGLSDTIATFFRGRLIRKAAAGALSEEEVLRDVTHPAGSRDEARA
jgi:ribose transport system ATP-binding protein